MTPLKRTAAMVLAVGLSGVDGKLLTARRRPVQDVTDPSDGSTRRVDFGHVGDIESVDVGVLRHLLDGDSVPVVCSLATDREGRILNVNADTIAARLAAELNAAKYFLVTTVDGVLRDPNDRSTLQSYLDIDALKVVSDGVNRLRTPERAVLVITHYQRILEYLEPDHTHVLIGGRIVRSGDRTLAVELEERGYAWLEGEQANA